MTDCSTFPPTHSTHDSFLSLFLCVLGVDVGRKKVEAKIYNVFEKKYRFSLIRVYIKYCMEQQSMWSIKGSRSKGPVHFLSGQL